MEVILEVKNLYKRFGGFEALKEVNLSVKRGTIHALIGPNGAGKTTLLNIINGLESPTEGEILFEGQKINHFSVEKRANLGLGRTFQLLEIFGDLTVLDNIKVALFAKSSWGLLKSLFLGKIFNPLEKELEKKALSLLQIVGLSHKASELAKNLPAGEQKLLEICRALALQPKLLLLDEPAAGLNTRETKDLALILTQIKKNLDLTILIVEHDMELVMRISDFITVLNFGEVLSEGTPLQIQKDPKVIKAYLGEEL